MTITFNVGIWHGVIAVVIAYMIICFFILFTNYSFNTFNTLPLWKRIFLFPVSIALVLIKIGYMVFWMLRRLFRPIPTANFERVVSENKIKARRIIGNIYLISGLHTNGLKWWHRFSLARVKDKTVTKKSNSHHCDRITGV